MKLLKISPTKKILFIFFITTFINITKSTKELHLAEIDAKLDVALSKEEELKDNPAYREVLKSMLLNEEEENENDENQKPEIPKPVVKKVVKEEKTILNSQLNKLLTFLNKESIKDLSYLEKNEKSGKSGLGWVFKDFKDYVEKVKESDQIVFKHLKGVFSTLRDFPKVIDYHFEENLEAKKISQDKEDRIVENYFNEDRDYQVVIDETDDTKKALKLFLESLPEYVTDEDIKELSHHYIDLLKNYIVKEEKKLENEKIPKFSEDLEKVKNFLKKGKILNLEETDALMYLLKVKVNEKLEYVTSEEGNLETRNLLKEINLQIFRFQEELEKRINLRKPLKEDFDNLMSVLKQKILSSENILELKENVRDNLKIKLKNQLDKEFEEVDIKNVQNLSNEFSKNTLNILESKLKNSLSEDTIQKVVFNLARAAEKDLENLKDSSKKSDFIWDINNINQIAEKASEEIKLLHEKNGKIRFRINLKEFDNFVKKATDVLDTDYMPEKLKDVKASEPLSKGIIDSGKYLEKFEDDIYNLFVNEDTKKAVEKYSKSYLNKFKTFYNKNSQNLDKSNLVNTFFEYIHENENLEATPTPKRLLNSLIKSESLNSRKLSFTDKKSLKFMRHLLLRWLFNYKHDLDYAKIFENENNHLLDIVYHKALYLGPDIDEALGKNEKRRLAHKKVFEEKNKKRNLDLKNKNDYKSISMHFLKRNLNKNLGKIKGNLESDLKHLGNSKHMKEIRELLDIANFHLENAERDLSEVISDLK